ncbi:copper amine oxidase N-terminal domain-containing protein [Bacillus thuringiensis]|uniref:copper amine oxidase N-terminal domain-containing protein n=1 Tax=Bacillus thuringiensis TaxID=1428 RepID=UPI0021D67AAB|nr:copper amine oxidase N-terminal domain-containing protein [Bacillus thuringiensis]MCU7667795.1 copper amine oxidase N-terminal domain-containing protein [Bacillus thuringiensis]
MKKIISGIVATGILFSGIATQTVSADVKHVDNSSKKAPISKPVSKVKEILFIIDGKLAKTKYKPVLKNNRILVPIQPIADSSGGNLKWDSKTKKTTITYKEKKIEVTNGQKAFFVNGKKKSLDVPIQIINGKVYVPLKIISEGIGGKLFWDAKSSVVSIQFQERVKATYYYVDGKGKAGTPITFQQYDTRLNQGIALGKELVFTSGVKNLADGTINYTIGRKGNYMIKGKKSHVYLEINGVTDKEGKGFLNGKYFLRFENDDNNENEHDFYAAESGKLEGFDFYSEALDYAAIDALEKFGYIDTVEQN